MRVTIVLIDHHPVVRTGLRSLLSREPALVVVGEASDPQEGRRMVYEVRPSLVIAEAVFPGNGDGIGMASELERAVKGPRALILTAHEQPFFFMRAQMSGLSGYALKTQVEEELLVAVKERVLGRRYIAPAFARYSVPGTEYKVSPVHTPFENLSKREREIFDMVITGAANESIARNLHIGVATVQTHRLNINRKLHVHSTGELIRISAMHGLIVSA